MKEFSSANIVPIGSLKRRHVEEEEISAFGYESKIYNDNTTAIRIEQGKYLIPWRSSDTDLLMDRYDVRHLIDDKSLFVVNEKAKLEKEYDTERYNEKSSTNAMQESHNKAAIAYDYECKKPKLERIVTEIEAEIMRRFNTPKSMIVPYSMEQLSIITSTSKEINSAPNPNLLEIRIQVKNARNVMYSFLNKKDALYPFYKHIGTKRFTGNLVEYSDSDSEQDN